MAEIIPRPFREKLLLNAMRERDTDKRQSYSTSFWTAGHVALCDLPAVIFTPDLMDMYPDVKIVLNGRPNSKLWAQSCYDSLGFFFTPWFKWVGMLWETDRLRYALNMECRRSCKEKFDTDDIFTAKMYETYYASVRLDAKRRGKEVLEFRAEDGWEPLCQFLEKDVPNTPFPRLNEKKTFTTIKIILIAKGFFAWLFLISAGWMTWKVGTYLFYTFLVALFRLSAS